MEFALQHTDDVVWFTIERDRLADDVVSARVSLLPGA